MVIVNIDDYEWWIGESRDACVAAAARNYGEDPNDAERFGDAHVLDDAAMDSLKYTDADENERPIGEPRSFREQMAREIAEGGEFPRLFAATDW